MSAFSRLFDSRLASLAVVLLGAVAALLLAVDSLVWYVGERHALAEQSFRTSQLEARAASLAGRQQNVAQDGAAAGGAILLQGDTPGLVTAEMQRIVSTSVQGVGAVVRSLDAPQGALAGDTDGADDDGLERVRLNAEIEVMQQTLPDLLYALETDRTVLIVDGFSLRGRRSIDAVGSEAFTADDRELTLRIELSSFRLEQTP